MGKHSVPSYQECPDCGHEVHDEGKCYHCGIFSDDPQNPCTRELGPATVT
jgi:hypothetical protein